jgi:addiction module RelE/StbE family toxin
VKKEILFWLILIEFLGGCGGFRLHLFLEKNPLYGSTIRPLTGQLKGLYRYRIGDWRVIYQLSKQQVIVEIIAILPRGNVY